MEAKQQHTHLFSSRDRILREVGLSRYTLSDLVEFCESYDNTGNEVDLITINEDGTPCKSGELFDALIGNDFLSSQPMLLAWNNEEKKYINRELSDYKFLGVNDNFIFHTIDANKKFLNESYKEEGDPKDFYKDVIYTHNQNRRFINQIRSSASGCVDFVPQLYYSINNTNHVLPFKPNISFYLRDPIAEDLSSNNQMALKKPMISDIPKTPGGFEYGFDITKEYSDRDVVASFRAPVDGGDENLKNKVAGYLDISYNDRTKKYEAGTRQLIARLLGDLQPVQSPSLDPANINDLTHSDLYDKNSDYNQLGDWDKYYHTTSGIPLYVHKNNPQLFGPAFIDKHNRTEKKEIVPVVNRADISFKAGEMVILNYINGEWIPQKFTEETPQSITVFRITNWKFQKLITDSDSYFRDKRYYENLDYVEPDLEDYENIKTDPESYTQKIRNKYYLSYEDKAIAYFNLYPFNDPANSYGDGLFNFDTEISKIRDNKPSWDFIPSPRYWQVTAFDQIGHFAGGKNEANILGRTNLIYSPDGLPDDDDLPAHKFIEFWGPSFRDGYKAAEVQALLSEKYKLHFRRINSNTSGDFFCRSGNIGYKASNYHPAIVDFDFGKDLNRNWSKNYNSGLSKGMFGNQSDLTARNLPAEVATLNAFGVDGAGTPLEDIRHLIKNWSCPDSNFIEATDNIFAASEISIGRVQNRYNWLYRVINDEDKLDQPLYNLTPDKPNIIDFFPLNAEIVSSTDYARTTRPRQYGNATLMSKHLANPLYSDHLLGEDWVFERNKECVNSYLDNFGRNLITHPGGSEQAPDEKWPILVIPHNAYVKRRATGNIGGVTTPMIWPEESASCVGIIASTAKVRFKGDQFRFNVDQYFGLPANRRLTLGTSPTLSILPINGGVALSVPGNSSSIMLSERWGGASDNPESFHTTALHLKIYDSWPMEQTIYDARYFAIFHFNPGVGDKEIRLSENPLLDDDGEIVYDGEFPVYTEELTYSVDYRVPTFIGGSKVSHNYKIADNNEVKDKAQWKIDIERRGKLLTNGGYTYRYHSIGLPYIGNFNQGYYLDYSYVLVVNSGSGYSVGDKLYAEGGSGTDVELEVTEVDSLGAINVEKLKFTGNNSRGRDYLPTDFADLLFGPDDLGNKDKSQPLVSLYSDETSSGSGLEVYILRGQLNVTIMKDQGPKQHGGTIRLTDGNNRGLGTNGDGPVKGMRETYVDIDQPNNTNEYDLFFFFHNDISHTVYSCDDYFYSPPQRVSLEMSAI